MIQVITNELIYSFRQLKHQNRKTKNRWTSKSKKTKYTRTWSIKHIYHQIYEHHHEADMLCLFDKLDPITKKMKPSQEANQNSPCTDQRQGCNTCIYICMNFHLESPLAVMAPEAGPMIDSTISGKLINQVNRLLAGLALLGRPGKRHARHMLYVECKWYTLRSKKWEETQQVTKSRVLKSEREREKEN